jgi:hypothetical protein
MFAEIDNAMPARKHVAPDDKIGLNLTADERDTILKAGNPERKRRLNGVYARIEELLAAYCTHEKPN